MQAILAQIKERADKGKKEMQNTGNLGWKCVMHIFCGQVREKKEMKNFSPRRARAVSECPKIEHYNF